MSVSTCIIGGQGSSRPLGWASISRKLLFEGCFRLFWRHWERDLSGSVFPILVSPLKVGGNESSLLCLGRSISKP